MVATSRTNRGRSNSRRTTRRSTSGAERAADGERDEQGDEEVPVVVEHELGQDGGAEGADLAVGEVDDRVAR